LADINLEDLVAFHHRHKKLATVTAVPPTPRFGSLELCGNAVSRFSEKPRQSEDWINGGFFVFEPAVLDYIEGDDTSLERAPLERLAADGQLMAYRHPGFWHAMDTLRDKNYLESLWREGQAPWA
jgi:glucose-1-phosphate cytidylyltransferase